jgi:CelD/BcsL family acetyltransferase involved in cellulose biosynthesis
MGWLKRSIRQNECVVRGWWARRSAYTCLAELFQTGTGVARATIFQTPEWVDTLAEAAERSARATPFLVTVGRSGAPASMALPLAETVEGSRRLVSFIDFGLSDYNAPVLLTDEAFSTEDVNDLWAAVKRLFGASDLICLAKLPETIGGRSNPLLALPSARKMSLTSCDTKLFTPWTECEAHMLSANYRGYLKSKRRSSEKHSPLQFRLVSNGRDAARAFDTMSAQRRERFTALGAYDVLSDPVWRNVYARLCQIGVNGGATRLFTLDFGAETIATLMGLAQGERLHVIMLTFANGEHRSLLPGLQLLRDVMSWAAEAGFTTFDFTIGDEEYKAKYAVTRHPLFEVVEPLSFAGLAPTVTARAKAKLRAHPALLNAARLVASRVTAVAGDRRPQT